VVTLRLRDGSGSVTRKWLIEDVDRHGNVRLYFRRPGEKKVRLREEPGTDAFLAEYQRAYDSETTSPDKAAPGTFAHLCVRYYASPEFRGLDWSTRAWRQRYLDGICRDRGSLPVAQLGSRQIRALRDELADKPGAARSRLKAIKALFNWAVKAEHVAGNPARDVEMIRYKSNGHHSWTMEEIAQYEARHPIGTQARLAMTLLLYTAGRREDACRLGPQHVKNGRIRFTQAKNENRSPVTVDMPVHTDLARAIAATPSGHLSFLVSKLNKPFTPAGFGNKFREWCDAAGLPHCSAHGLRKAAATRLADLGATAHEIMAVTGHQSLEEAERYTKTANKAGLADRAFRKLEGGK
jgi:integrase/recombinase XerD